MRLYIIRHGQTAWNAANLAQGHTDIPLDELGQMQSDAVALVFKTVQLENQPRVWSSDLVRCKATALAIAANIGCSAAFDKQLRERAYGDWEGLSFQEIRDAASEQQEVLGVNPFDVTAPNGESIRDTWARLEPVSRSLFECSEDAVIVTHGGSSALLLSQLLHGSVSTSRSLRFNNCSITELHRRPDGFFQLDRYNDVRHLAGLPSLAGDLSGARS